MFYTTEAALRSMPLLLRHSVADLQQIFGLGGELHAGIPKASAGGTGVLWLAVRCTEAREDHLVFLSVVFEMASVDVPRTMAAADANIGWQEAAGGS